MELALQSILNDFLGLPPEIFNFLKLVSMRSEDIKKEKNMLSVIKAFGKELDLDSSLL